MHPEVRQEQPGRCPKCGMGLILASNKHAGHGLAMFARKFWVSLLLTIPVVVLNFSPLDFFGAAYIPLALGTIVFFYGGWVFITGAIRELRGRSPGMMTLIGMAISVAYVYSIIITVLNRPGALWWELTTLITVMLLGHWMEMRAVQGAQGALKELSKLLPDTAELVGSGSTGSPTKIVPISELKRR